MKCIRIVLASNLFKIKQRAKRSANARRVYPAAEKSLRKPS